MKFIVHTDGGARGNPGPAAVGVVIDSGEEEIGQTKPLTRFGKRIGETTNNVAEYQGVILALEWLKNYFNSKLNNDQIKFYLDSTLVVNQLNGKFKVKDSHLRELLTWVRILEQEVGGGVSYAVIPREQNVQADYLVNQALDF